LAGAAVVGARAVLSLALPISAVFLLTDGSIFTMFFQVSMTCSF
jgi:hypothetical protein